MAAYLEVRLFESVGAKNSRSVRVNGPLNLEIWTKGTHPRKNGAIEITGDTVRFREDRVRINAVPNQGPSYGQVESLPDVVDGSVRMRAKRFRPPSAAGLWILGTDYVQHEGRNYRRLEIHAFNELGASG